MKAKELRELADGLFSKKQPLLLLHQEIAENFYPERADFTFQRYLGAEFATNLSTSYPIICRRELAGSFATMLRPKEIQWFEMVPGYEEKVDLEGKAWLEWATTVQRRAMYDRASRFSRAVVESDNDFAAFGNSIPSVRLNQDGDTLLYRCHHPRDMAWVENEEGVCDMVFRKWKPQARYLDTRFPGMNAPQLAKLVQKTPLAEVQCMHMVVPMKAFTDDFKAPGGAKMEGGRNLPWVSIYYDCMHNHLIEAVPTWNKEYAIERWQTVSGSQYAYSPATVAALPDARLLQSMTYTLLEAGEKATNPPMVATQGAVRSDIAIYAGGVTWVDEHYDERLGDALRPMTIDKSGMPIGIDMQRDSRSLLKACFFIDKLKPFVPTQDPQMTAFQAGQIVAQYIRDALPIFEPMESERNGQICELTFDLMLRAGAFGSPFDMPDSLKGKEITFQFQSPLHDMIEAQKGHKFLEMNQLIAQAVSLDQNAAAVPKTTDALRDALAGIKVPASWINSQVDIDRMKAAAQEQEQAAAMLQSMQQGADVAETTAGAIEKMAAAEAA